MYRLNQRGAVILALSSGISLLSAASPSIGVALSDNAIILNHARTGGNATVFSGSTLQTETSPSLVKLKDGAQVRLASDSRGTLFADHLDLEKGSARLFGYSANASGLSIRTEGSGTATVSMQGKVVEVAALTGNVHVFNAAGVNVANLAPGRALNLRPQDAGASAPSSMIGCAVGSGDNMTLTDETSNVVVQLRGAKVRAGRRVQVTGSMVPNATPTGSATQVISVTSVKEIGGSCAAGTGTNNAGTAAAAGGAGAAAGSTGAFGASTAVIAGVAAVGAVGLAVGIAATQGGSSGSSLAGSGAINPTSPPM